MFALHIIGTAILLFHVISINAQFGGRRAPAGNFPVGQGTGGGRQFRPQQFGRGGFRFQGAPPGFGLPNVPPPPGFQQINRQLQNALPRQLQNALPRNPAPSGTGVNSVISAGGFTGRFGAAQGSELTRQLSPAPPGTFGGFSGAGGGAPNLPGANRIQGVQQRFPPNFVNNQIRQGIGFGQQFPGAVPLQGVRGPRNQPQAVMPRQVGSINLNSLQPGQTIGGAAQPQNPTFNFPPQTAQTRPSATQFGGAGTFQQQRPQQTFGQTQQTFAGSQQSFTRPQQPFTGSQQTQTGPQQPFVPQQTIPQQTFGTQQSFGGTQQPFGQQQQTSFVPQPSGNTFIQPQPVGLPPQGAGRQPSFAFQQPITQPLGVGRPSSETVLPPGAPKLLPGEVEIAPPISPAAAAAITSGGTGGAPPSVSEIITISDINGNVLYRGVDLSDKEIEKITTQLVNNMSDTQAADAAKRGRELEAQGKLDSVVPAPLPTDLLAGQSQQMGLQQQQLTGQQGFGSGGSGGGGFNGGGGGGGGGGGQGFASWGQQQGLRFPGFSNQVAPGQVGR